MIYTAQLVLWQIVCTTGLVTALLSLRFRWLVLKSVRATGQDDDLVGGARQNLSVAMVHSLGWLGFFVLGILAVMDIPAPQLTAPPSILGQTIGWVLLGTVILWAYLTTNTYAYTLRKWWENPISSQVAQIEITTESDPPSAQPYP